MVALTVAIWAALVGTAGLVMAFARTPPDEAIKTLSSWGEWAGVRHIPRWVRTVLAGRWLFWGTTIAMAILLLVGGAGFSRWLISDKPPDDLVLADVIAIQDAFVGLPNPCRVKLTATEESMNPRNILRRLVMPICEIVDDQRDQAIPLPNIDQPSVTAPARGLTVRWDERFDQGPRVYSVFAGQFKGVRAGRMPPGKGPVELIWIDVGTGYPWKRHP